MKSTADRYREAGMPPPWGEAPIVDRARRVLRKTSRRPLATPTAPLPERVHDPADPAGLPELPENAYGPDSVPLDPDADTTEETS